MQRIYFLTFFLIDLVFFSCNYPTLVLTEQVALQQLTNYHQELDSLRNQCKQRYTLPNISFFQFGMGNRTKLLYKNGVLTNALTKDTLNTWHISTEIILPADYCVFLKTKEGKTVIIKEDSLAVWISGSGSTKQVPGTANAINLPDFHEFKYPLIMKELHHEILMNIVNGKPVPNFYVYSKPWRRDGAMMAMCLEKTGNIRLLKDWVLSITDPFDRNNAGESEADNLGQTLYLISIFSDKKNPLVAKIQVETKMLEVNDFNGKYIKGRSDFHEAPVYQTKWLKFGLKKLGLPDNYSIPKIEDNYSALFWWDYKDTYLIGTKDANDKGFYPYLGWASDHFHKRMASPISNRDYPLTWEIQASQANYSGMAAIDTAFALRKISVPHTWQAAEIFMYLDELKNY